MYVDSHAHIDTKEFDNDRDYIVNECEIIIVNAGIDIESNIKSLTLEKKYKNVIAAVGFHPEFVKDHLEQVEKCLELVDKAKIVSEIGLDYFWIKEQELRRKQIEILSLFLNKAEKQRKPAIIHVRGGMNDFLNMISSYKVKFVIHAFEGNVKTANKVIELGGMISIPPVIVRDKQRQEVVKNIDLDYILTETDSPFLGPEKMSRNKPCNVVYTIRKISELKGVDEKEVIKKIEDNFKKLIS
ncbi:hydrolase TatD [Sulfolobus sp. SCGC AB-777_L09]|jgi:TatD DNase family protein|nr:hydrolase TatD [Sulfolobus sp. SCGC AB-777_L09]